MPHRPEPACRRVHLVERHVREHAGAVHPLVERALALWDDGAAEQDDAVERFLAVYTDPVVVNGVSVPLTDLVARAAGMAAAFTDRRTTVHDVVEGDGFLAFAFEIRARHVRPWVGLAAAVPPSGREVTMRGMDIFHVDGDGRVARLWAVNDQSDLLSKELP
jgi:predicted ester cyclase